MFSSNFWTIYDIFISLSSSNNPGIQEKEYHAILDWLAAEHTYPLLLEILASFWYGDDIILDDESSKSLQTVYNIMQDIGLHQMWMGFLPVGIIELQEEYYQHMVSKTSANKGIQLY